MLDSRLRGNDVVVEKALPEAFALSAAEKVAALPERVGFERSRAWRISEDWLGWQANQLTSLLSRRSKGSACACSGPFTRRWP